MEQTEKDAQKEVIDRVKLEAYSLAELLGKVEEKFKAGFSVDFITNQGYPTSFGSYLTCDMVLYAEDKPAEKVAEKTESTSENNLATNPAEKPVQTEVRKPGRPKNS